MTMTHPMTQIQPHGKDPPVRGSLRETRAEGWSASPIPWTLPVPLSELHAQIPEGTGGRRPTTGPSMGSLWTI